MTRRIALPDPVRELQVLDRVDYSDAFTVETQERRTPGEWARLSVDSAPRGLVPLIRVVHVAIGLRLAPRGADGLLGWDILRDDEETFVLGVEGGFGTPRIVVQTPPGRVVLATLLELHGLRGRAVWALVGPLHRAVARLLLARGQAQDRVPA